MFVEEKKKKNKGTELPPTAPLASAEAVASVNRSAQVQMKFHGKFIISYLLNNKRECLIW